MPHPDKCLCRNGVPSDFDSCPKTGLQHCNYCDHGYHKINDICQANHCSCDNGFAANSRNCPEHGLEYCESCLPGFFTVGTFDDVKNLPSMICRNCPVGATWNEYSENCEQNECVCDFGIATLGVKCFSKVALEPQKTLKKWHRSVNKVEETGRMRQSVTQ